MRIIAGQWRGRPLLAPKGEATRPTADRAREALFSMLTSRLGSFEGLRVADLFAGSGALGLEALSRGAAHCTFVEQDGAAVTALKANIARLGAVAEVRMQSVMTLRAVDAPFDLLLLDPPYGSGAGAVALDRLARLGWLTPATLCSVETGKGEGVDVPGFAVEVERVHGKAKISLLRLGFPLPSVP
ncbi:16S rRNA (guanine(966)-N(2))-methyltransferase RsmD [Sandaracinobacteroides saxicola]|uniref:16S rRNA (Guanine(966)-N(2))-methyltransferase RsmD n=1 Tax=Sandaracinobacteroides saxicola TaxID=2759707 RepID=A0A7G5IHE5_9SPHN|nr:16S rRNA (guanine(966)-N(2))-methyltransferase RsmD [Sandaracinobacteroides saxicola]QMW22787.1 16S rRNA (guanine(966)-N(2))-methyltransferase RsmD [Sandaracinobacteroides saxicola]